VSRVARTLRWEALLQARYGMPYAAAFVALFWVAVLRVVPAEAHIALVPVAIIFDTAIFGLYLMSGLLFMEKSERVLNAVAVTPMSSAGYLSTKLTVLTALALAASAVIVLLGHGGSVHWPLLLLGASYASVMMMLAGFLLATRFNGIGEYLLPSALLIALSQLPLLDYFGMVHSPIFYLVPSYAPLIVVRAAFVDTSGWLLAYGVLYPVVVIAGLFMAARRNFDKLVVGSAAERAGGRANRSARGAGGAGRATRLRGLAALAMADWRRAGRDPFTVFMLIYVVVLAAVGRWVLPWAMSALSSYLDLTPYRVLIVSFLAVQAGPLILGSALGLMLLDERDEGSLLALRVTPISMARYALYRGAVPMLLSMFACAVTVLLTDLPTPSTLSLLSVSALAAVEAPLLALFLATFARNKVEGLALMKGMSVLMFAPVAAWFLDGPWHWLPGVIPTLWPAEAFWRIIDGRPYAWVVAAGFVVHLPLLWWMARRFQRKVSG